MPNEKNIYGPDNPHPLSSRKTELIWEGKYDEYGNRREVDIAGCAMPMQKIETIDEPASRLKPLGLFDSEKAHKDDFRNMLIWGDNKLVMASLLKDFKGKIDLIYIDPPFDVGADFTMNIPIGDKKETVGKDQSTLEMLAYKDMWGMGTDSYLHMMYERLVLMKELLSETGSIYVHCDWHVGHYLKLLLDEIFGQKNFLNEIVWYYYNKLATGFKRFARAHDNILLYSKGKQTFNVLEEPRDKPIKQLKRKYHEGKAINVRGEDGKVEYRMRDTRRVDDVWRISCLQPADTTENTNYNTQKPELLISRMIQASSNEGDLVADFFCGSGTTGAVAERLGRRWIMADLGRFAIHTTRKRMIGLQRKLHEEGKPYRAFDVYNLGRYERQWWQKERLRGADEEHRKVVLGFYRAEVLQNSSSPLIHGRKGSALCHVDSIDGFFTRDELRAVAGAAKEAGARELHCLAWEFEMDLRLVCLEIEHAKGIRIKLVPIPREIMEKNRTSPPPFLEVAVLEAEPVYKTANGTKVVDIKLTKFVPSLAEIPSKELETLKERAIKSGFDFIDFWAVDFDYQDGQPFEHHWQTYRTRKNRSLPTVSDSEFDKYPKEGKYTACVKVVDIFGCDTSITVEIEY